MTKNYRNSVLNSSLFSNNTKKKIFLILGFIFFIHSSFFGQNLLESKPNSRFTYIFKITDLEAKQIYKNGFEIDATHYFHQLIDSFPTYKIYKKRLAQGHYLKVYTEKNQQRVALTTTQDFNIYILNNSKDLNVKVTDLQGEIISNAKVKIKRKKIKFNPKTQLYTHKKSNKKGLLEVSVAGFTCYYQLSKDFKNSHFKRITNKIIYQTPLYYVWVPIRYTIHLPIDGVKSIYDRYPRGTIYRTKRFFRKAYYKTACLFDDYYCDEYISYYNDYKGYLVFSKPKYKIGDTVKLKAFITNKKGKPINKTMDVSLYNGKKSILLTQLEPYRKGAYAYNFAIHDSLQLKLDKSYSITFSNGDKEYLYNSFVYEEYELKGNKLDVSFKDNKHYNGDTKKILIKATDINNLPITDGRIEVSITTDAIANYYKDTVFVPNTLQIIKKKLDAKKNTELIIADSIFPAADISYKVRVRLLTSDNESITQTKTLHYYHNKEHLSIKQVKDSLLFEYFEGTVSKPKKVQVSTNDNFGNSHKLKEGITPFTRALNSYYARYKITSDSLTYEYKVADFPASLQCNTERTADSIHIQINNPAKIPFHYSVYKNNIKIKEGYGEETISLHEKSNQKKGYFLFLNYIWGGIAQKDTYEIPYKDKSLNITVLEPKIITPGQTSEISLLVTDAKGKPVQNVDITAYSLNKKFNYQTPQLPYFDKKQNKTALINRFDINDIKKSDNAALDYQYWKKLARIDSIAYYKFIYPQDSLYRFELNTEDKTTEFAPFVFSDGDPIPIHTIYVDYAPVYFSWTTKQPYSFPVSPGKHFISIRTAHNSYSLDSITFKEGKKTILSFDQELFKKGNRQQYKENKFTKQEQHLLKKYIIPYREKYNAEGQFSYIQKGNRLQILDTKTYWGNRAVGPFSGTLNYVQHGKYNTIFTHEQGYEYEFEENLLKMRAIKIKDYLPLKLKQYGKTKSIYDIALTQERIEKAIKTSLNKKRRLIARYDRANSTQLIYGQLRLNLDDATNPVNIILHYEGNSMLGSIYNGNQRIFHNLRPEKYKLILLHDDHTYQLIDNINIKSDGVNYIKAHNIERKKSDLYLQKIDSLLSKYYIRPYYNTEKERLKTEKKTIMRQLHIARASGESYIVQGNVSDETGGLPGVSVIIKGTDTGTETDFDGNYSIQVFPYEELEFSFIGMETVTRGVNSLNYVDVVMKSSYILEEVVVTAMGIRKERRSLGYSVSNNTTALNGRIAGVAITTVPGSTNAVIIRGMANTQTLNNPLIIVDGMVYSGDINQLNKDSFADLFVLKGAEATTLYGSAGANGVIIVTTKNGMQNPLQNQQNNIIPSNENSIRNNFSDEAFWQPKLTTNKLGKVKFKVTFPDDVTTWSTHYLAMNSHKQTGSASGQINAYKNIMAELSVPRFLLEGDSVTVIGKTRNLTKDSLQIKHIFSINDAISSSHTKYCNEVTIDSLAVLARKDSLSLTYIIEKEGILLDGEKRAIPVLKKRLNKAAGNFIVMQKDTTLNLSINPKLGNVNLYARADLLEVLEDELKHIVLYKYDCNEQLASKLKSLIALQKIALYKGEKFKGDKKIEKIISRLTKNRHRGGLWGWWAQSAENFNISTHVIAALLEAKEAGYSNIDFNTEYLAKELVFRLKNSNFTIEKIQLLKLLKSLHISFDYKTTLSELSKKDSLNLFEKLSLVEVKQLYNEPYSLAFLEKNKQTTLFGNTYYTSDNQINKWWNNDIQNTVLAYKLLHKKTDGQANELHKIRQYFLEKKRNNYWRNTYESISIVGTLLPDFLQDKKEVTKPKLQFSGDFQKTVTDFPFSAKLSSTDTINVTKTGDFPIYFTYYQEYWDPAPKSIENDFIVTTHFSKQTNTLVAGEPILLTTNLTLKKDAEFVMLNIPIPAGCTYQDKTGRVSYETHREYFNNETSVFFEYLPKGEYTIKLKLIPRYTGTFTLNPAQVSLMYFPTFNANDKLKKVLIE